MGGRVLHFLVAALAVGGLAAIGADRASPGAGAADAEGGIFRITINAASGIDSMDPALASSPPGWALLDTTCARLMAYPDKPPPAGFRLQPEVAADFPSISRDRRSFTFRCAAASGSATGARCARARSPARSTACSRPR